MADRPPESIQRPFRFLTTDEFDRMSLDDRIAYLRQLAEKLRTTNEALRAMIQRRARNAARAEGRRFTADCEANRIDQRLSEIAQEALAGQHVERPWDLFLVQYFPGWEHEQVAAALGAWSTRQGIRVAFESRPVRDLRVIFVRFRPA
jgi:hypothetical protein